MRTLLPTLRALCFSTLLLLAFALLAGCHTQNAHDPINPANPWIPPGVEGTSTNGSAPVSAAVAGRLLRLGERITVSFSDLPPPGLKEHDQRIREDGTVTLPYNITVHAAGKTTGELEEEIRQQYVPKLYLRMTVTVKTEERVFFVGGEVKIAARQPYLGQMTVLRAIQSAGDFTDFANRKKIELIRATGERHVVNWYKAIKNPELDLEVYPGDSIIVHRRWF